MAFARRQLLKTMNKQVLRNIFSSGEFNQFHYYFFLKFMFSPWFVGEFGFFWVDIIMHFETRKFDSRGIVIIKRFPRWENCFLIRISQFSPLPIFIVSFTLWKFELFTIWFGDVDFPSDIAIFRCKLKDLEQISGKKFVRFESVRNVLHSQIWNEWADRKCFPYNKKKTLWFWPGKQCTWVLIITRKSKGKRANILKRQRYCYRP